MDEMILVEHSEPGLVIKPVDSFENVLRHISYERALELRQSLIAIAQELGPEYAAAIEQFHLEVPGDSTRPPALATLGDVDYGAVKRVTEVATERGLGEFRVGVSLLLEGKAQTREDYVAELRFAIETAGGYGIPPLPDVIRKHRSLLVAQRLGGGYCGPEDAVGHLWVRDMAQRSRRALEAIDNDVCAVIRYELERLDPSSLPLEELARWCTAALWVHGERFVALYTLLEAGLEYLYQRAGFAYRFHEAPGPKRYPAMKHLEERMTAYLAEAQKIYTPEAVAALEQIRNKMLEYRSAAPSGQEDAHRPPLLVDEVEL